MFDLYILYLQLIKLLILYQTDTYCRFTQYLLLNLPCKYPFDKMVSGSDWHRAGSIRGPGSEARGQSPAIRASWSEPRGQSPVIRALGSHSRCQSHVLDAQQDIYQCLWGKFKSKH